MLGRLPTPLSPLVLLLVKPALILGHKSFDRFLGALCLLYPYVDNEKIRIADGSLAPIVEKGQIVLNDKSEVSSIFQNFYHTIETQFHTKIAILWSDNGRKFQNHNLSEFLASKGIVHQTSCAYTPQQNGVAERKNRHLVEVARSLMLSTSLPSYLWGDAILTVVHLINRMPSHTSTFRLL
ncbi:Beta-galactosidase [Cucumis melo var. makuwa]|uniref:Beta-galactosidase n=1 Tax=Cucumis melo var. makuwa TaxID=1194695 RepID=A0A5A7SPP7_CUCMM|nr:Beta-galactosidase [Cucumis melo var. makuwa]TYK11628.1 Beta-galactosidase [Cucumis melo var. makuwa]